MPKSASITPDTLKRIVEARLLQTFRQYPRAGLQLSSTCRDRLLRAVEQKVVEPDDLTGYMAAVATDWTVQAKLAFADMLVFYREGFEPCDENEARNLELLRAVAAGIRAASRIS